MIKNKNSFSYLKEKDMQVQIELGDDGQYVARGVGTVNFHRESDNSLHLRDVLYVPRLRQNLVSVAPPLRTRDMISSSTEVRLTSNT